MQPGGAIAPPAPPVATPLIQWEKFKGSNNFSATCIFIFRHDYFSDDLTGFKRVIEGGVKAERLIPTFPSVSFTNYYSIATGKLFECTCENRYWTP